MNSCTAGHTDTAILILFVLPSLNTDLQNTNIRHPRRVKFPTTQTFKMQTPDIPGGSNFPCHRPSKYEHQPSQEQTSHGGQISHVTDLQNQTSQKPTSQEGQIFRDTNLQNMNTGRPTRVKFPMTWASKYNTRHPRRLKFQSTRTPAIFRDSEWRHQRRLMQQGKGGLQYLSWAVEDLKRATSSSIWLSRRAWSLVISSMALLSSFSEDRRANSSSRSASTYNTQPPTKKILPLVFFKVKRIIPAQSLKSDSMNLFF